MAVSNVEKALEMGDVVTHTHARETVIFQHSFQIETNNSNCGNRASGRTGGYSGVIYR